MKKWLLSLLLSMSPSAVQAQQLSPYFQVGDTSPLTLVWETASGAFVVPTTPDYQAYLSTQAALGNIGIASQVCGVANNGGSAQIQVCTPALIGGWATGQIRTVFGVGAGANGTWTITVDNLQTGLVTLQGSTFVAGASGVIGAAPQIDTARNLYAQIDKYNRFAFVSGQTYFVPGIINSSITLTNPLAPSYLVEMPTSGLFVTLPQANVVGSLPIGQPLLLFNPSFSGFTVRDMNLNVLKTVTNVQSIMLMLLDNGTKQGSWALLVGSN